jgi:hypothetical protein
MGKNDAQQQEIPLERAGFSVSKTASKLLMLFALCILCCFQRAKVRKMKAIHNQNCAPLGMTAAVFKEQKYEK